MPLSVCSSIFKNIPVKEFIFSFADSAFHDYLKENNLIPEGVKPPTSIDLEETAKTLKGGGRILKPLHNNMPTTKGWKECLERKRETIKHIEEELRIMETTPMEQLLKKEFAEHAKLIKTNNLTEADYAKYMAMLNKIGRWKVKTLLPRHLKKHIQRLIRESMIADKYNADQWFAYRRYYMSIPEKITEAHARKRINGRKDELKKSIMREKKEHRTWKLYSDLWEKFCKELTESLNQLPD